MHLRHGQPEGLSVVRRSCSGDGVLPVLPGDRRMRGRDPRRTVEVLRDPVVHVATLPTGRRLRQRSGVLLRDPATSSWIRASRGNRRRRTIDP
ncbi:hypothetical protein Cus16_0798 [Curtobacterium sp. ER1/6]|nr:hypothetical protein Cus16_0798 [Curtobacterium sp. ER1/6]